MNRFSGILNEKEMLDLLFSKYQAYLKAGTKEVVVLIAESMWTMIAKWTEEKKEGKRVNEMMEIFCKMCSDHDPEMRRGGLKGLIVVCDTTEGKTIYLEKISENVAIILKQPIQSNFAEDLAWLCYILVKYYSFILS